MYIYADNAGTTKMSPVAIDAMTKCMNEVFGNPSSLHSTGQRAAEVLQKAREDVAEALGADFNEIYFTSGGSEADNQAIRSAALFGAKKGKKHLISTKIEHHAVLHTLKKLEREGFEVTLLDVGADGIVDPADVEKFLGYAAEENLEAVTVAVVTEDPRLVMNWRGKTIVDISRAFLDTNGAHQEADVTLEVPGHEGNLFDKKEVGNVKEKWLNMLSDLNVCSQKGLVERFDGSIGAGSVFMPFGGKYQLTETQSMVAKLPVLEGHTDTVTMMSYGFDPYLSSWSPYHGAVYAVVSSVAKIVAAGGDYKKIRFTFQEYFRRMSEEPDGASHLQHSLVLTMRRWALDFLPSAVRTVCPVPLMMNTVRSMYLRHLFPLQ